MQIVIKLINANGNKINNKETELKGNAHGLI